MTDGLHAAASPRTIGKRLMSLAVERPRTVLTLVTIVLTTVLLVVVARPLSPDVSGQLWIAAQLRHGARLYLDISEINPPLWFWLALPVDAVADLLGARPEDVLIVALGCGSLLSLLATNCLIETFPAATRIRFLCYGAVALVFMALRDVGQREQMALIGALPYVALIAARRDEREVPSWLGLAVGGGAALGFALKHYFVAVPLVLELWLLLRLRRRWRPLRPELLVLAAGAASYVGAIMMVTPEYLRISVPELLLAYGSTGARSLGHMIRPAQPVWLLVLCAIVAQRAHMRCRLSSLATGLLLAALGFFAAWLIQHKGWPYQSIATTGCLALAMAATLAEGAGRPRPIAVAALLAPMVLALAPTQWVPTADTDIAPALDGLRRGDVVAIVSEEGRTAWPATTGRGLRFSGRRGAFWGLAAVTANELGAHDPRIAAFGRKMVRDAVIDYRCLPPQRLIFAPGRASKTVTSASENPLGYFMRDAAFVDLLGHYRRMDLPGNFDAFALTRPFDALPAAICRHGTLTSSGTVERLR